MPRKHIDVASDIGKCRVDRGRQKAPRALRALGKGEGVFYINAQIANGILSRGWIVWWSGPRSRA
jgi:hypothetical protein